MSRLSHPTFLANLSTLWHLYQMRTWGVIIVLAAIAAPALAQGFAPGFHVIPRQPSTTVGVSDIASDGSAICGGISGAGVVTGYSFDQSGFHPVPNLYPGATGAGLSAIANGSGRAVGAVLTDLPLYKTHGLVVDQDGTQRVIADPSSGIGISFTHVSADGGTALGRRSELSPGGPTRNRPILYTPSGTVQYLPYIPNYGATYTEPLGLSADGHVICGGAQQYLFNDRVAWTWTQQNGYQILPDAPNSPYIDYQANAASDDGTIIVGRGATGGLRWVNGVVQTLPAAPGFRYGYPIDVSGDGSIITGTMSTIDTNHPVQGIWTEATGWVPFTTYLQSHGIDYPPGFLFTSNALYVSSDGLTFAGTGTEAFVIRIPTPSAGLLVAAIGFTRIRRRSGSPQKARH